MVSRVPLINKQCLKSGLTPALYKTLFGARLCLSGVQIGPEFWLGLLWMQRSLASRPTATIANGCERLKREAVIEE